MQQGFESWTWHHMRVEVVVGSHYQLSIQVHNFLLKVTMGGGGKGGRGGRVHIGNLEGGRVQVGNFCLNRGNLNCQ